MPAPTSPAPRSRLTAQGPPIVQKFLLHLASERGLADNSLHAYRRDLQDFHRYLAENGAALLSASPDICRAYLRDQTRRGQSTRTVTRRLAAIRAFLRYLMAEPQYLEWATGVLQQLDRPRPERSLPKILSKAQVCN